MPTRYLKPGVKDSDRINGLSAPAENLFYRLLVTVDDFGRFDARSTMVKSHCYPIKEAVTPQICEDLLAELARADLVTLYRSGGKSYLQLSKWDNKPRATESKCPPIPADYINPNAIVCNPRTSVYDPRTSLPVTVTVTATGNREPLTGNREPLTVTETTPLAAGSATQPLPKKRGKKEPAPTAETWAAYSAAYLIRYAVDPVRNATVNGQLAQLVARLGAQEAPQVAGWYLSHRNQFYTSCGHSVGILLRDCEKLRTEWATGRQGTHAQAVQSDRTQTNLSAFAPMMAEALEREKLTGGKPE